MLCQANHSKFVRAADLKSYYATLTPPSRPPPTHTQPSYTDKGEVLRSTDLTHTKEPNHPISPSSSELLRLYECPDWLSTEAGDWKFFGPVPS